ncbi:MAG: glycosyltransferase [Leptolyngbyaceae cyanobacterium bins.349]|nr:glycosyltransferase [Leptolyngbyaceae cyanobacterium bins.349]
MRVLYITSDHYPDDWKVHSNGSQRRRQLFIDAIKEIAEIDLLYYVPPGIDTSPTAVETTRDLIRKYWDAKVNLFLCPQNQHINSLPLWQKHSLGTFSFFKQWLYAQTSGPEQIKAFEACLSYQPDFIFAQRLTSMPPVMLTAKALPPVFFDLDDIEHIRFIRQIKTAKSLQSSLYWLHVPARFWGEYRAIQKSSKTFVCSELDKTHLGKHLKLDNVEVIPNSTQIPVEQEITSVPTLLLLGSYSYGPNIEAAEFLIEKVLPRVQQVIPQASLIIAGRNPQNIRFYSHDIRGVEFLGFVHDLEKLYLRSRVVCCPIFSGAGTRIKIVEAAAYGKPIVATCIGIEGLQMENGKHFLLRNEVEEFSEACIELLQDSELCKRLGSSAREQAIKNYEHSSVIQLIQKSSLSQLKKSEKELLCS